MFINVIMDRGKAAVLFTIQKERKSLKALGFPALNHRALGLKPRISTVQLDRAVLKSVLDIFTAVGIRQGDADGIEVLEALRAHLIVGL